MHTACSKQTVEEQRLKYEIQSATASVSPPPNNMHYNIYARLWRGREGDLSSISFPSHSHATRGERDLSLTCNQGGRDLSFTRNQGGTGPLIHTQPGGNGTSHSHTTRGERDLLLHTTRGKCSKFQFPSSKKYLYTTLLITSSSYNHSWIDARIHQINHRAATSQGGMLGFETCHLPYNITVESSPYPLPPFPQVKICYREKPGCKCPPSPLYKNIPDQAPQYYFLIYPRSKASTKGAHQISQKVELSDIP